MAKLGVLSIDFKLFFSNGVYVSTIRAHLFLFFHMQIADFLSRWDGMPMGRWVRGWEVPMRTIAFGSPSGGSSEGCALGYDR